MFARGHLSLLKVAHGYACIKLSSTSGTKMGRRNLFILLRQQEERKRYKYISCLVPHTRVGRAMIWTEQGVASVSMLSHHLVVGPSLALAL